MHPLYNTVCVRREGKAESRTDTVEHIKQHLNNLNLHSVSAYYNFLIKSIESLTLLHAHSSDKLITPLRKKILLQMQAHTTPPPSPSIHTCIEEGNSSEGRKIYTCSKSCLPYKHHATALTLVGTDEAAT